MVNGNWWSLNAGDRVLVNGRPAVILSAQVLYERLSCGCCDELTGTAVSVIFADGKDEFVGPFDLDEDSNLQMAP
jgi:hypothetical protein